MFGVQIPLEGICRMMDPLNDERIEQVRAKFWKRDREISGNR